MVAYSDLNRQTLKRLHHQNFLLPRRKRPTSAKGKGPPHPFLARKHTPPLLRGSWAEAVKRGWRFHDPRREIIDNVAKVSQNFTVTHFRALVPFTH